MTSRAGLAYRYMLRQKGRTGFVVATYTAAVAVTLLLTSAVVGNEQFFINEVNNLAVNWIYVEEGYPYFVPLSESDAQAVQSNVSGLSAVAPILWVYANFSGWGSSNSLITLTGTTPSITTIFEFSLEAGTDNLSAPASPSAPLPIVLGYSLWTQHHLSVGQLLPADLVRTLAGGSFVPVPATFVITGLLNPRGSIGQIDLDSAAFVPISSLLNLTQQATLTYIFATASSASDVTSATGAITGLLTDRHDGHEDFTVENQQSEVTFVLSEIGQFQTIIQLVEFTLLLVSAFSIFVVMTMAVKDRRREIGVLRALGAERSDVIIQFMIESGTMSVAGLAVGVGLGTVVTGFLQAHSGGTGLYAALITNPVDLGWYFVELLAVLWGVGFLFSLLPAYQASRLEAVEALREM
jgi:putative ABC transport system permease protein